MIGSPSIPFSTKRAIDEDHRGEMKEMNEYDVQKRIKRPMNAFMVCFSNNLSFLMYKIHVKHLRNYDALRYYW